MSLPELISTQTAYRGYFDMRVDALRYPGGAVCAYTVLEVGCDAALVLAATEEGGYLITREYRHPTGESLLSLPGGRLDPCESPLAGAQRELLEETGYEAKEWHALRALYPFPGVTGQRIYFFFARGAERKRAPSTEPSELITVELMPADRLQAAIAEGHAVDGNLCSALFLKHLLHP